MFMVVLWVINRCQASMTLYVATQEECDQIVEGLKCFPMTLQDYGNSKTYQGVKDYLMDVGFRKQYMLRILELEPISSSDALTKLKQFVAKHDGC